MQIPRRVDQVCLRKVQKKAEGIRLGEMLLPSIPGETRGKGKRIDLFQRVIDR